jgi:type VI protein secretion system component VasF
MIPNRFTGRKPLRTITPMITTAAPVVRGRFESKVDQSWEAQQRRERHIRYVALLGVSFVTVLAVLASFTWLSVHQQVTDIIQAGMVR